MVTRPHSPWLAHTHTGRGTGRRETGMLEITRDGEQLQVVYLGCCSLAFLHLKGIHVLSLPVFWPWKMAVTSQSVGSHFLSAPPKICQFQSRSQVLSRGSLTPTLPLLPQPLLPPLLSNPAARPLLCILHLPDYSAVSKHSAEWLWAQSGVSLVPFFGSTFLSINPSFFFYLSIFLAPLSLECLFRTHNEASLNKTPPSLRPHSKGSLNVLTVLWFIHLAFKSGARCEFIASSSRFWKCWQRLPLCARHLRCHSAFCKSQLTLKPRQTSRGDAAGLSKRRKVDPAKFCLSVTQADCLDSSLLMNDLNFPHAFAPSVAFQRLWCCDEFMMADKPSLNQRTLAVDIYFL